MYHAIVARKTRAIFAAINRGDPGPMLDALSSRFRYRFEGATCLGGERTTREAMERWWARLYRLFPETKFEVRDVLVSGWPWSTRIATYLAFRANLPTIGPYENVVVQMVRMRWGRIDEIHTLEDSLRCWRTLQVLAEQGNTEANAAPIADRDREVLSSEPFAHPA